MNHSSATDSLVTGPISHDWTIEELLDWFAADDDRLSDASLRKPLLMLEEALTGRHWLVSHASPSAIRESRSPAIVSLVRSIALHSRAHRATRARTVAEVVCDVESPLVDAQMVGT